MAADGPGALPIVGYVGFSLALGLALASAGPPAPWARTTVGVLWAFGAFVTLGYYVLARRGSVAGALFRSYGLPSRVRAKYGDPPGVELRGPRPLAVERITGRVYPDVRVSIDLSADLDRGFLLRKGTGKKPIGSETFDADATADGPPALVYGLLGLPLRNRLRRLALDGLRISDGAVWMELGGRELDQLDATVRALKGVGKAVLTRLANLDDELASTALTDPATPVRIGAAHALWALDPDSRDSRRIRQAFASSSDPALLAALDVDKARKAGIEGGEVAIAGDGGGLALTNEGALSKEKA